MEGETARYDEQSDDEFKSWIAAELRSENPQLDELYPNVFDKVAHCILKWRKRYQGNSALWNRVFKKDRVIKEAMESVPVIQAVDQWMRSNESVTIIDLCSGKVRFVSFDCVATKQNLFGLTNNCIYRDTYQ